MTKTKKIKIVVELGKSTGIYRVYAKCGKAWYQSEVYTSYLAAIKKVTEIVGAVMNDCKGADIEIKYVTYE